MSSGPAALLEQILVGRDRELAQLVDQLNRAPALVAVAAEPGMGKTSLVRAFAERARTEGWTVVAPPSGDDPLVDSRATVEHFSTRIEQLLDAGGDVAPLGPSSPPSTRDAAPSALTRRLLPLIDLLRARAPAIVVIEDFDADPRFASWFERRFVADLVESGARVLLLITGRPAALEGLKARAALSLSLGPLSKGAVRAYLLTIGARIRPALEQEELDAYVRSGVLSPPLLASLATVLSLAQA